VQGFAAEDRVPFPFEFAQADPLTPEEEKDARFLFADTFQCSSCHPSKASTEKPVGYAPDLTFARERLRYEWVKQWLEDPASILPGTGMPPFWEGDVDREKGRFLKAPKNSGHLFRGDPWLQMRKVADYVFLLGKGAGGAGTR
jgi:hypothetical protein